MSNRSADAILSESFLDVRAKLLEIAATLDRIDHAIVEGIPLAGDALARRERVSEAIRILLTQNPDRAEQLQRLFSREYQADWRTTMNV